MYVFRGGGVLHTENGEACADTLMNGHWEELIGKVEELFDATDDPDNKHIQHIILYTSDGQQCLNDGIVVNPPPHWLYIAFSLLSRSWVQILHLHSVGPAARAELRCTPLSAPSEL